MRRIGVETFYQNNFSAVTEIIAPADNTDGVIIRTASITTGTTTLGAIMAKTSAPSSHADATAHHILDMLGSDGAHLLEEIELPAGMGLYADFEASSADLVCSVTWDHKENL
ncbi:MAG: hypothetical protein ACPG05_05650 [Bdellovibrionales bacterium]